MLCMPKNTLKQHYFGALADVAWKDHQEQELNAGTDPWREERAAQPVPQ
jgi:hypothetical protein